MNFILPYFAFLTFVIAGSVYRSSEEREAKGRFAAGLTVVSCELDAE